MSGSGTQADPYVVDATGTSIAGTFTVADTASVALTLDGSGSVADPYELSADATVSVGDLTDVAAGSPATGDTLLWDGTTFVYGPPSSGGGGATVTVGDGLSGNGSVGDPVALRTSGLWGTAPLNRYGTNSTLGAPVYVDANGQVRSQPLGVQVLSATAARPAQYPGRVIIQDGIEYYSNGSSWVPLTAIAEGPFQVPASRFAQIGITRGDADYNSDTYMSFWRYGPIMSIYCNAITFTPVGGVSSGNLQNQNLMTLPSELWPPWGAPLSIGAGGRPFNYYIGQTGQIQVVATPPKATSGTEWGPQSPSIAGMYMLAPGIDPNTALDRVKANAISPDELAEGLAGRLEDL